MVKETQQRLINYLLQKSAIREPQARDVRTLLSRDEAPDLRHILIGGGFVEPEILAAHEAEYYDFPYVDLRGIVAPREARIVLPIDLVLEHKAFCFEKMGQRLKIAIAHPENNLAKQTLDDWAAKNQYYLEYYLCSLIALDSVLEELLGFLNGLKEAEEEDAAAVVTEQTTEFKNVPTEKIISLLLGRAVASQATHIHFLPSTDSAEVKMRVNGNLEKAVELPLAILAEVIKELKDRADLDLSKGLPQSGVFEHNDAGNNYQIGVSSFPVALGESISLSLGRERKSEFDFLSFGFSEEERDLIELSLEKKSGLILVAGPQSSGRSTTLLAMLDYLKSKNKNVTTLEDTIEHSLVGVNHTQVRPELDFTFANGLRSLIRHDQDVIMVGEIRDHETAEMVIHAAMTGHLILASVTAVDVQDAITRLLKMKVEPFLLASVLHLVVAQRLLERNCPACQKGSDFDSVDIRMLNKRLSSSQKVGSLSENNYKNVFGQGCGVCDYSGVKGKILIAEVLPITPNLERTISVGGDSNILQSEIRKMPIEQLFESAWEKVQAGEISLTELNKLR